MNRYERKKKEQESTELRLNALGKTIEKYFQNKGFALIIFELNAPGTSIYISNGQRADMITALREAANRLDLRQDTPIFKRSKTQYLNGAKPF